MSALDGTIFDIRLSEVAGSPPIKVMIGCTLGSGSQGVVRELTVIDGRLEPTGLKHFVLKSVVRGKLKMPLLFDEIAAHAAISNMFGHDECNPFVMCMTGILIANNAPLKAKLTRYIDENVGVNINAPIKNLASMLYVTDTDIGPEPHIIYEKLDGAPLNQLINAERGRVRQYREISHSLLNGLAALHSKNVVHRDIKPENIMIKDGQAQYFDLGLACVFHEDGSFKCDPAGGTPQYMAPEIFPGSPYFVTDRPTPPVAAAAAEEEAPPPEPITAAQLAAHTRERFTSYMQADVFAMGATLYALLFRRPIHEKTTRSAWGGPPMEILRWAVPKHDDDDDDDESRPPPPPTELSLRFDDDETQPFHDIIRRMLRYNRHERPTAAEALAVWSAAMGARGGGSKRRKTKKHGQKRRQTNRRLL